MSYKPLAGIRVADFTWAAVGPFSTNLLASMGAQVIKVGSARQAGGVPPARGAELHRQLNHSKDSISLNLTDSRGVAIARRLIAISDVVAENFRPGILEKFDLHYEEVHKIRPDIVMVSASILGQKGPYSRYAAFAPIFGVTSGLSSITGVHNGIPTEMGVTVDCTVGLFMAQAVLTALYHRNATGEGQYVDLAGRDAIACTIGDILMEAAINNRDRPPMGNRDEAWVPHGAYPCRDPDTWISIAVTSDAEWQALCDVMERPDLVEDTRYGDQYLRGQHREELDSLISEWTRQNTPLHLTELLQRAGVPGFPTYSSKDLFEDPHLKERHFFYHSQIQNDERPYTIMSPPWLVDGERPPIYREAVPLGEDNVMVLGDLMGMTPSQIENLTAEGVLQ